MNTLIYAAPAFCSILILLVSCMAVPYCFDEISSLAQLQQVATPNGTVAKETPATPVPAAQDQSGTGPGISQTQLEPILDKLFSAREQLLRNNNTLAFDELNDASSVIYSLSIKNPTTEDKLKPLLNSIEGARTELLINSNSTAAVINLNGADTEYIKVVQNLPS